ncbi:MAG TPA: hypothetical protein PLN52_23275 [Opitutaceae bacterium]|nr:hypothetical protein [Opitutaceae bacterium]
MRHRWPRRHPCRHPFLQQRVELGDEGRNFILRRLHLIFRRHLAGIDLLHDLMPEMGVQARFEIARELVDAQVALLFVRAVAADAMLLKEGLQRRGRGDSTAEAKAGAER